MAIDEQASFLAPAYLADFACNGPVCPDTCCTTSWTIELDQPTYARYQACTDRELQPLFRQHLQRLPAGQRTLAYGRIAAAGHSGDCPMLDSSRLCRIQSRLGEAALSHTCFAYPRHHYRLNGVLHQVASLSCPETARLALASPDAMAFTELQRPLRPDVLHQPLAAQADAAQQAAQELHYLCLQLMAEPALALWQALAVCGVLCQCVQDLPAGHDPAQQLALLDDIRTSLAAEDGLLADLAAVRPDYAGQARLLHLFATMPRTQARADAQPRFGSVMQRVRRVMGDSAEQYARSYPALLAAWQMRLEDLELDYVLRNYLLNLMQVRTFPLDDGMPPTQAYASLVVAYLWVRGFCAALAAERGGVTLDDMVLVIQTLERTCEHDRSFLLAMAGSLQRSGLTRLEALLPLLP